MFCLVNSLAKMLFNQKYLSYQSSFALEKFFFHALIGIDKSFI